MYKHCITEESVLRQRQLEHCLLDLMQTVPYTQITITDICNLADISRKSFYRYFGSKEDCLHALIDHSIFDGASHCMPEYSESSQNAALFTRFFHYWNEKSPLLDALSKNNLSTCLAERMVRYVNQEEPDYYYYLGGNMSDSCEGVMFMISGLVGLIFHWHSTGFRKTPAQMAAALEKILQ